MSKVMDFRKSGWGHALYQGHTTKTHIGVTGCSTPKPEVGDYLVIPKGFVVLVETLDKMGNPSDGFHASLRWLDLVLKNEVFPTVQQIEQANKDLG